MNATLWISCTAGSDENVSGEEFGLKSVEQLAERAAPRGGNAQAYLF